LALKRRVLIAKEYQVLIKAASGEAEHLLDGT
jgi:hypothetical protein